MTRYLAAGVDELAPETAKKVVVAGIDVCLARAEDGTYYAIADTCSHEEYSLSEGEVWGREVECPAHGSRFDLATGEVRGLPATEPVRTYQVEEDGEGVHIVIG